MYTQYIVWYDCMPTFHYDSGTNTCTIPAYRSAFNIEHNSHHRVKTDERYQKKNQFSQIKEGYTKLRQRMKTAKQKQKTKKVYKHLRYVLDM